MEKRLRNRNSFEGQFINAYVFVLNLGESLVSEMIRYCSLVLPISFSAERSKLLYYLTFQFLIHYQIFLCVYVEVDK